MTNPFFERGGNLWSDSNAGVFAFNHTNGDPAWFHGVRTSLVSQQHSDTKIEQKYSKKVSRIFFKENIEDKVSKKQ